METTISESPFAEVVVTQQPFGCRVRCVLNLPCLSRDGRVTGFAIEGTGAMDHLFGMGPFGPNQVQPVAIGIANLLAGLDESTGTSAIFWGTGDPDTVQPLGFRTSEQWRDYRVSRPKPSGTSHRLLPALRYFLDGRDAKNRPSANQTALAQSIYVFALWDVLDDYDDVNEFCRGIVGAIDSGGRRDLKLVFLGIGAGFPQRNQGQMQALAALCSRMSNPPILSVVANDITNVETSLRNTLWASIAVAKTGAVLDAARTEVRRFDTGVPGAFEFFLPSRSRSFWLNIDRRTIRYDLATEAT